MQFVNQCCRSGSHVSNLYIAIQSNKEEIPVLDNGCATVKTKLKRLKNVIKII